MSDHLPRAAWTRSLLVAAVAVGGALTSSPAHAVVGDTADDSDYAFTARLDIGDGERACSGALVDEQWLLTAASCLADDPAQSSEVPSGKPDLKTTATIGRTDLTTRTGQVRDVVELVPRPDRDLVLARLARPVTGVTPVALSTDAPSAGEELRVTGYGRTQDEWAPLRLHTGAFTVDSVNDTQIGITGKDGAAVCKGDTGGPALREQNGKVELVAVNSRSWQGGCFGSDETRTGAIDTRVDDLGTWIDSKVGATPVTDFNCDGLEDVAVADPEATVAGRTKAGLVRIVYGGGKGTAEISQNLAAVPGGPETGDRYGDALAVFDHNEDGCSDLAIGAPREDIGSETDAGAVHVLYGSRDGLGKGQATLDLVQGNGTGSLSRSASEAGDRMGHSLAAGHTAAGEPYLVIGIPGEDLGNIANAGSSIYLHGTTNVAVHQDTPGVAGVPEKGDRFGSSVAASSRHVTIGVPGEGIGNKTDSGSIQVLSHTLNKDGIPTPVRGIHQDVSGVNGSAEADDQFGAALAMAPYHPSGSPAATDSIVVVGSPGEAVGSKKRAGRVVTFRLTASGGFTQLADIQQDIDGVAGGAETGDRFGEQVSAVHTEPGAVSSASNMLLAVGIPGEDLGTTKDTGAIQVFSLLGAPGDSDTWLEAGSAGLPGTPGVQERMGESIAATGTHLYVGMPHGPAPHGAAHTLPWANVTSGTNNPVTTHQPGKNGLPAVGKTFGAVIR